MRKGALGSALVASIGAHSPPAAAADRSDVGPSFPPVSVFVSAFVGDGLRFNNPYRLATILGSKAQSLSRTAAYADAGAAFALGNAAHAAQGLSFHASVALDGVPQAVFDPSYILLHSFGDWAAYGRAGVPIVLSPDMTWGFEGAAGAVWFFTAGVGVAAELVGDVFYGAGTREVATPAYPVLSGQAGIWLSWEALL